ncbi:hypothetical protein ES708_20133 [subsurface metagenome]
MKLGIFLLIFGLLIAGAGTYAWQYYNLNLFDYRPQEAQQFLAMEGLRYLAMGIGGIGLGSGLAFGGIIRMVVDLKGFSLSSQYFH